MSLVILVVGLLMFCSLSDFYSTSPDGIDCLNLWIDIRPVCQGWVRNVPAS